MLSPSRCAHAFSLSLSLILAVAVCDAGELASTTFIGGVPVYSLRISRGDAFSVVVNDQVKDGCWLTADDTASAVRIELARSNYSVAEQKDAEIILYLSALGWDTGDGYCAISYSLDVIMGMGDRFYSDRHEVISLVHSTVWSQGGLLTGGKATVHSLVKEKLVGLAQEFLLEVAKNQNQALRDIRSHADEAGGARRYWVSYSAD